MILEIIMFYLFAAAGTSMRAAVAYFRTWTSS